MKTPKQVNKAVSFNAIKGKGCECSISNIVTAYEKFCRITTTIIDDTKKAAIPLRGY
jgi:hypothetical protein